MKRTAQDSINSLCIDNCEHLMYSISVDGYRKLNRLRNTIAEVLENDDYIMLLSYNTIVAFIDKKSGVTYDILRLYGYTKTCAKHIIKFIQDYAPTDTIINTYRKLK